MYVFLTLLRILCNNVHLSFEGTNDYSIISLKFLMKRNKIQERMHTLCAITPSLSSSARRRINSNNFSLCFLLALVQLDWKHSKRWSNCSGEKSQASLARRSCTFFTIASCFPAWAAQTLSKSSCVSALSLIINRKIFSSFSTYWGWCNESRSTICKTLFSLIHFCKRKINLYL